MIATMQAAYPELSIRGLCQLVGVNRAWYAVRPSAAQRSARDADLRDAIEVIVLAFPGYGYRRVTVALQRDGWEVNHKRVLRVMRQESLLCHLKRQFVVTTDSAHGCPTYPNLLATITPHGPDQAWVADVTYIRLPTTFVYLACILDAWSRRCVGWHVARTIETALPLAALNQALTDRQPRAGLIHHSDQGVQYASAAYTGRLHEVSARISMAARGNPYQNAKAESFFKTLKREEVYLNHYQTFHEAQANLEHFIADVYNAKRLHSSLGYRPPIEFEATHAATRER